MGGKLKHIPAAPADRAHDVDQQVGSGTGGL